MAFRLDITPTDGEVNIESKVPTPFSISDKSNTGLIVGDVSISEFIIEATFEIALVNPFFASSPIE